MLRLILPLLVLISFTGKANAKCALKKQVGDNKHIECTLPGASHKLQILDLHGDIEDTAYYHGYFLGHKVANGPYAKVNQRLRLVDESFTKEEREQYKLISSCILGRIKSSVSGEFKDVHKNMVKGMKAAGVRNVSYKSFLESNLMSEMSIYFDVMQRNMSLDPLHTKLKLFRQCGLQITMNALKGVTTKAIKGLRKLKMGCTGLSASGRYTASGDLIHARNFDTGLLGNFEKNPLILIHHPKKGIPYVGIASAGLHYAGGITGFNKEGISVSIHELRARKSRTRYPLRRSDIGPYLLNRILMKAKNINQAIKMVKSNGNFGNWSFLISDAKTHESVSIEITGDNVEVAKRQRGSYMGQTNHFIAPIASKLGFEYSFNKSLESRSRLTYVERMQRQNRGSIDVQWVINRMSSHIDEYVGLRSFGRTVTKVYTSMSHVMVPGRNELWFSSGDLYPTNLNPYHGIKINFNGGFPFRFIGRKEATNEHRTLYPNWTKGMGEFVQSYLNYASANPSKSLIDKSLVHLNKAIELSNQDGIFELPYHFMKARMYTIRGTLNGVLNVADIQKAITELELIESANVAKHRYQDALNKQWLAVLNRLVGNKVAAHKNSNRARWIFEKIIKENPNHYDLKVAANYYRDLTDAKKVSEVEIHFATVE